MDINAVRSQFPALQLPYIFLDNPGGTQIARQSLDRITHYLLETNANHGGVFATGRASDLMLDQARAAVADFLNARRSEEIVFGANMTTLTFALSRAIALTLQPGDTLVVTRLDHDGNIAPWLRIAQERGCRVRWVDIDVEDCTLNLADLQSALSEHPKLVAVGYASNAVGTINPVKEITRLAHQAGAWVFVDAVQYAPHGPIDVQDLDCDFLACSAYKFFGPHVGLLYGRYELLEALDAYKVRPAPALPPEKYETGTQNHEGIAGTLGALEYFEWLGENFGADGSPADAGLTGRRLTYRRAMQAVQAVEMEFSRALIEDLQQVPGLRMYGITDLNCLEQRVPTVSFTLPGYKPRQIAEHLAAAGINVWAGNFYALALAERLEVQATGGLLRVGATHYNTAAEIHRFGEVVRGLARKA